MLKRIMLFTLIICLVFILFTPSIYGQGLVIDHTAVQLFDQIPDYWLEKAKELTMYYSGKSHSLQIISGCKYLEEEIDSDKYKVSYKIHYASDYPNPTTVLPPVENPPAHRIIYTARYPDGYWESEAGRNETKNFAATGLYDYSMFGWCGEFSSFKLLTDYINDYLTTMDTFERDYPNMKFIYQTAHTADNPNFKIPEHNNQVREYCIKNNKVLFDFADIESWDHNGNQYPENNNDFSWCQDWVDNNPQYSNLPPESNSGNVDCCPHVHGVICLFKAKAYWYMLARLAGWDGQVPVSVEVMNFEAHTSEEGVMLNWGTTTPKDDNFSFEIYRSQDESSDFQKIGFINGYDTSTINRYSFIDKEVSKGTYYYQIKLIVMDGSTHKIGTIKVVFQMPNEFNLAQNYPNPFNAMTVISYNLPKDSQVELIIYDINSREISKLINNFQTAGSYNITWNANNLPSGQYYYSLKTEDYTEIKKTLLVK